MTTPAEAAPAEPKTIIKFKFKPNKEAKAEANEIYNTKTSAQVGEKQEDAADEDPCTDWLW